MTLCKAAEGCIKEAIKVGFCATHYRQVQRGARAPEGHLVRVLRATYTDSGVLCLVDSCHKLPYGHGMCSAHYQQFRAKRIDAEGRATDPSTWVSYYKPGRKKSAAGPCKLPTCRMQRVDSTTQLCGKHTRQVQLGIMDVDGNVLREQYRVRRYTDADLCRAEGCSSKARSNFFCMSHAGQFSVGLIDANGRSLREQRTTKQPTGQARHLSSHGYVMVSAPPGHPHANTDGNMFEHRLVMEQHLGRYLLPTEIVHHRDSNRQNNDIANLEMHTRRTHPPGGEFTAEHAQVALDALRVNDPAAYAALLEKLKQ